MYDRSLRKRKNNKDTVYIMNMSKRYESRVK